MEGEPDSDMNDDDLTVKIMFREIVWLCKGLEAEYRSILLRDPRLLEDIITIRYAAKDALSDYGVFASKRTAPFTLKGLVDAVEAVREKLENGRKGEARKYSQSTQLKHRILNLLKSVTRMILGSL